VLFLVSITPLNTPENAGSGTHLAGIFRCRSALFRHVLLADAAPPVVAEIGEKHATAPGCLHQQDIDIRIVV
jgi:hypothetical protein